jgi:hypothetical protein
LAPPQVVADHFPPRAHNKDMLLNPGFDRETESPPKGVPPWGLSPFVRFLTGSTDLSVLFSSIWRFEKSRDFDKTLLASFLKSNGINAGVQRNGQIPGYFARFWAFFAGKSSDFAHFPGLFFT